MKSTKDSPGNIDEYITGFPVHVQNILMKIHSTIKRAAPDANAPMPLDLIEKIVKFRVEEAKKKSKAGTEKK